MFAPERHQAILDLARSKGRVDVRDLAEQLDVTPETIRRDLTSLERRGLVRRAHGGAVPIERASLTRSAPERETIQAAEKNAIAAAALAAKPSTSVHLLGGQFNASTLISVGAWTHQMIGMVSVDIAFLSVEGITPERGFTTGDLAEGAVKSAMIRASRRAIVLADHSKFGAEAFGRIAPLAAVDTIITDSGVNPELASETEAAGPIVVRAASETSRRTA